MPGILSLPDCAAPPAQTAMAGRILPTRFRAPGTVRRLRSGKLAYRFQLAVNKGYGIELDVQLTADGELAVHHAASLLRTCGVDRKISEMTAGEIRRYPLGENGESVPFFQEVLELVHGQAPLIVELKQRAGETRNCPESI